MEYFCKIRFNSVARHAGGKIENDPKYGFYFGHGGHEFHHLLPKDFKAEHPETCRQIQPDDFLGERVNDVNFCYSSEGAWIEIEKNFAKHADEFKDYDHLVLEFADLPGGGHCLCANCRHYSASDVQAIVMNRFAEIVEKLGLKATVQMNAYHDTMMPSLMFPPRKNILIAFAPRERCWAHSLTDPACERNKFYLGDEVDVLPPSGIPFVVKANRLVDEYGQDVDSTPHPMQRLELHCERIIPAGSFLRVKKK